jgi:methylenetetrahydrofolate dehydrogenase (NADP+)/methenyltetrahydrofolate cyclohydrolase
MAATLIDGERTSQKIRENIKTRTAAIKEKGIIPCLAVILVGDDAASLSYVNSKEKALAEAGMENRDIKLPSSTNEAELLSIIDGLNKDEKVHGILIQSPLPKHIDEDKIIMAIDPKKDVDCFHPLSVGNMILCKPGFLPCTPHGVLMLLREYKIPISGSHAVVVGRSNIVGRPLAHILSRKDNNATVTLCHTGTRGLVDFTKEADILIVAVRSPEFIKPEMIKEGAAVIDVGINRVSDPSFKKGYRVCGDVDPAVADKAGFYTPVPGGVGPMTITMLLQNVVEAAERSI